MLIRGFLGEKKTAHRPDAQSPSGSTLVLKGSQLYYNIFNLPGKQLTASPDQYYAQDPSGIAL